MIDGGKRISTAELDKIMLVVQTKHNKLAIRALVDKARQQILKSATDILDAEKKHSATEYVKKNRQAGEIEQSWKLQIKALDHVNPTWKEELGIDVDMFETINAEEYNKVLCAPAHEFSKTDIESAVAVLNADLQGFYDKVIAYSRL